MQPQKRSSSNGKLAPGPARRGGIRRWLWVGTGVGLGIFLLTRGGGTAGPGRSPDADERPAGLTTAAGPRVGVPRATPAWLAQPDEASELAEGYVPAWQVQPPAPTEWTPPAPREPPNPIEHQPPMENPGGVNGDRPERVR